MGWFKPHGRHTWYVGTERVGDSLLPWWATPGEQCRLREAALASRQFLSRFTTKELADRDDD